MFEDKLISADSHVDEPLELWQERLPVHLRHKAPHIEVRDGKRLMIQDGMRPKKMAMGSDEKTEEDKLREQGRAQGWDVGYRLNAQDIDGVGAEVVYPGTFGLEMACSPDAEFQGEVARVYNDWTTELFGSRRDRFAMAALIPVIDIPWSCQEMRRAAGLGMGSFFLPSVVDPPYNRVEYRPIWETVEETGVPLNFHISSGRDPRVERGPGGAVINYIMGALVDGIELLVYLWLLRRADGPSEDGLRYRGVGGGVAGMGASCHGRGLPEAPHVCPAQAGHAAQRVFQAAGICDLWR